jgi:2-methylcitrate dehydratase PrpD
MATAALLRLDSAATVHALGNAGTQSAGLWQFLEAGTMTKHLHAGRAAEAGRAGR